MTARIARTIATATCCDRLLQKKKICAVAIDVVGMFAGLRWYIWALLIGLSIGMGLLHHFSVVSLQWYHWVIFVLVLLVVVLLYAVWVRQTRKWVYITDEEVNMLRLPPMPDAPPKTMDCEGGEKHTLFLVNGHELDTLKAYANHHGIRLKGTEVDCYPPEAPEGATGTCNDVVKDLETLRDLLQHAKDNKLKKGGFRKVVDNGLNTIDRIKSECERLQSSKQDRIEKLPSDASYIGGSYGVPRHGFFAPSEDSYLPFNPADVYTPIVN